MLGVQKTSAALARSSHGVMSVGEQPEGSAVEPMPDVLGGLCSSSKEDTEAILRHALSSPAVAVPSPVPAADVGQPKAVLAEQAPAARPSSSPPPARPLAEEIRPRDMAETSAQGARQAGQPSLFMSKSVWCTFCVYCLHPVHFFTYCAKC